MISDKDAIAQAQGLYRAICQRLRKRPVETIGEVMFAEGLKLVTLFDAHGKLAAAYRIGDSAVFDLDGHELVKLRAKLTHRKVRG
jgi:hypothetical protein